MTDIEKLLSTTESLIPYHVGVFDIGDRFEIQQVDDTALEGFDDASALAKVVELASAGNAAAIAALYLDGRPVKDNRCFLMADDTNERRLT